MKPLSSHGATPADHILIFSDYNATFLFRLNFATPANHILIFSDYNATFLFRFNTATPPHHLLIFLDYSTGADHIFWSYLNTDVFNLTLLVLIV